LDHPCRRAFGYRQAARPDFDVNDLSAVNAVAASEEGSGSFEDASLHERAPENRLDTDLGQLLRGG